VVDSLRSILSFVLGDFLAKILNFLAFIYLARVLNVASYGLLEFASAILTYFLLLADGGLELWATREISRNIDIRQLASHIVSLRLLLAVGSFGVLLALLPAFPHYPALKPVLLLFGLTLFTQAANLKWVFMGQEKMASVAVGLVMTQAVFAVGLFGVVHSPERIIWVPVLRLVGDLVTVVYFLRLFAVMHGRLQFVFTFRRAGSILRPALTMGASHGLALMSYNFDSVVLGLFLAPTAVGWYNAAYKLVTMGLAIPVTYFLGLFPALSRTYMQSRESFQEIIVRSLRLMSAFAAPLGVGGTFLAEPIIHLLFGPAYANAVPALQVLSWSAVLVMLRGTYRQALNAAGRSQLDLRCACVSILLNVSLNLLFIPHYGIIGAAAATLVSEVLWLLMASYYFYHNIIQVRLMPLLWPSLIAAVAMAACFVLARSLFWAVQAIVAVTVYFGTLLMLSPAEVCPWIHARRVRMP